MLTSPKFTRFSHCASSVLNVPKSASQNEIRERYRALSVIFHPDKQHDDRTKNTASKRFLDVQKAYESKQMTGPLHAG